MRFFIAGSPSRSASWLRRAAFATWWSVVGGGACNVYTPDLLVSAVGGAPVGGRAWSGGVANGGMELGGAVSGGVGGVVLLMGGNAGAGSAVAGGAAAGGATAGRGAGGDAATGGRASTGGSLSAGGTTSTAGVTSTAGTSGGIGTASGGTSPVAGGAPAGGGVSASGGGAVTGGVAAVGGAGISACTTTIPTQGCALSIGSKGMVSTGSVKGTTFGWKSDTANLTTYVNVPCATAGCGTTTGVSAVCVSGGVTADSTFHSAAGLGLFLNEGASGTPGSVTIANSITVTANWGAGSGNKYMRIQLTDDANNDYCVTDGAWSSGTAIPITKFNTACWDDSGSFATPSTPMRELDLIIPSITSGDRPFDFCMLNVTIQ